MIAYLDLTKLNTFQAVSANATISGTISGINYLSGLPFRDQLLNTTVTLDNFISDIQTKVDTIRDALELIDPYVVTTVSGIGLVNTLTSSGYYDIDPQVRAVILVNNIAESGIYVAADYYRDQSQLVARHQVHNDLISDLHSSFDLTGGTITPKKSMSSAAISYKGLLDHYSTHAYWPSDAAAYYIPLAGTLNEQAAVDYSTKMIAPWDGKLLVAQVYPDATGGTTDIDIYINGAIPGGGGWTNKQTLTAKPLTNFNFSAEFSKGDIISIKVDPATAPAAVTITLKWLYDTTS